MLVVWWAKLGVEVRAGVILLRTAPHNMELCLLNSFGKSNK